MVVCLILIAFILTYFKSTEINDNFREGMVKTMKKYRTHKDIKELIDRMQIEFACCGSEKYVDWFQLSWIHADYVDIKLEENKPYVVDGMYIIDSVPYSCCRQDELRGCVNQHLGKRGNKTTLTINTQGCLGKLTSYLKHQTLIAMLIVLLGFLMLQCVTASMVGYLSNSINYALARGDPTLSATVYGDEIIAAFFGKVLRLDATPEEVMSTAPSILTSRATFPYHTFSHPSTQNLYPTQPGLILPTPLGNTLPVQSGPFSLQNSLQPGYILSPQPGSVLATTPSPLYSMQGSLQMSPPPQPAIILPPASGFPMYGNPLAGQLLMQTSAAGILPFERNTSMNTMLTMNNTRLNQQIASPPLILPNLTNEADLLRREKRVHIK